MLLGLSLICRWKWDFGFSQVLTKWKNLSQFDLGGCLFWFNNFFNLINLRLFLGHLWSLLDIVLNSSLQRLFCNEMVRGKIFALVNHIIKDHINMKTHRFLRQLRPSRHCHFQWPLLLPRQSTQQLELLRPLRQAQRLLSLALRQLVLVLLRSLRLQRLVHRLSRRLSWSPRRLELRC